jgi:hypothetical protein
MGNKTRRAPERSVFVRHHCERDAVSLPEASEALHPRFHCIARPQMTPFRMLPFSQGS